MSVSAPDAIGGPNAIEAAELAVILIHGPLYRPTDVQYETFFRSLAADRIKFATSARQTLDGMLAQQVLELAATAFEGNVSGINWMTFKDVLRASNITITIQ